MAAIVIPVIFIPVKRHRNTCWRNFITEVKIYKEEKILFFNNGELTATDFYGRR